ncbi:MULTISPECIES: hypothetical protein [unclassified Burkholderia]|uniref:hypothetical protein n=1 Tax=unclassified Burkholderia TaxID=2613784 RepID=UPI001E29947C|nr:MULTISPECIES: hypothetical protein [unclassified Burkholderia]UEP30108.1 hypothetical protein LMA01_27245 [Burkholderia sp. B21-007]UEP44579.1 hypothetical protein LMA02_17535 [Burkholderia sp. B21-005]
MIDAAMIGARAARVDYVRRKQIHPAERDAGRARYARLRIGRGSAQCQTRRYRKWMAARAAR